MIPRTLLLCGLALVGACRAPRSTAPPSGASIDEAVLARFRITEQSTPTTLDPIHVLGQSEAADEEGLDAPAASIELDDVLASVERHFPLILAAEEEIAIAEGRLLEAEGEFDTYFAASTKSKLEGYYENDRFDLKFEQPTTLFGATVSGGYRLGSGDFAVYDGDLETNDDGEFRVGLDLPLLRDRVVDARRVALWKSRIERRRADPRILELRLEVTRDAAQAYWKWVSAGRMREIAVRLLALAQNRMEQVESAVEEGLLAAINRTENQRLIVDRRAKLVQAERKLQEAALGLSLYWRDERGEPSVPGEDALPYEFPDPHPASDVVLAGDEDFALARRPEVVAGALELEQLRLDRGLAENALLPRLDVGLVASQDIGDAVNVPDDKEDFELGAVVTLSVPLQRRKAKGKLQQVSAKVFQLERRFQFLRDAIVADVRDARSALTQSWFRIGQARENVELANELAEAERFQLSAGESDLLRVNLREQQAAAAAAGLVETLTEYFRALAQYRAVVGLPYEVSLAKTAGESGP